MSDYFGADPGPADPLALDQEYLRFCATLDSDRLRDYQTFEDYYAGIQNVYMTDRAKTYLQVSGFDYNENFCETVVDALVERVSLAGIESSNSSVADWLWTVWWDKVGGDALQLDLHTECAKKGDAFLLLDYDSTRRMVTATWNPPDIIEPYYVDRTLAKVCKVWATTSQHPTFNPEGEPIKRMNIYYADRIEKYFTRDADFDEAGKAMWEAWSDGDGDPWPVEWKDASGAPLGLPVFHFANKPGSDMMGRSEIRGTIPQQDRLNKELLDLSYVLDQMGWPQRYATGLASAAGLTSAPGEVWTADSTEASFGQFDAADPKGLLEAVESTLTRIAVRSNTPVFRILMSGGYPSGEALKVAEAGLVAKAKMRAVKWGSKWVEVFMYVLRAQMAFRAEGGPAISAEAIDDLTLNALWVDPETRNEKEHLEALSLMGALGVSKDTLLGMLPGIDPVRERVKKASEDRESMRMAQEAMGAGVMPGMAGGPPARGGFASQQQQRPERPERPVPTPSR